MRMTEKENARFRRVAEKWGLSVANLLRALVAREERIDEATDGLSEPLRRIKREEVAMRRRVAAVREARGK